MRRRARASSSQAYPAGPAQGMPPPLPQQQQQQRSGYETINEGPPPLPRPRQQNPYEMVDEEEPIPVDIRPEARRAQQVMGRGVRE